MDTNTLAALRSVVQHERDDEMQRMRRELAAAHAANAQLRAVLEEEFSTGAEVSDIMKKINRQKQTNTDRGMQVVTWNPRRASRDVVIPYLCSLGYFVIVSNHQLECWTICWDTTENFVRQLIHPRASDTLHCPPRATPREHLAI